MSEINDVYKQALVAVLSETKEAGVNLDDISRKVSAGIMGNAMYTSVGPMLKSEVINALHSAIEEVKALPDK